MAMVEGSFNRRRNGAPLIPVFFSLCIKFRLSFDASNVADRYLLHHIISIAYYTAISESFQRVVFTQRPKEYINHRHQEYLPRKKKAFLWKVIKSLRPYTS